MTFETSSYTNGQWTRRTLDVDTVLQYYDRERREAMASHVEVEDAPVLGLLTQTVIRSPLVHWILPVQIRDQKCNDVAFVGDDFVHIKELRPDRHLWDVVRKENFGARIRNARVVGSMKAFANHQERMSEDPDFKSSDGELPMDFATKRSLSDGQGNEPFLPPQYLVLQLETGDSVFLVLRRTVDGTLEFISSRQRVPKAMLKLQPGMHLTIDPSSRYMAVGCSETLFAIYALYPREELAEQYRQNLSLRPIEFQSFISVRGVILKIEFLHPAPDDEEHIILLVLVVVKGRTRMLLYEWQTGNNMKSIHSTNTRGVALSPEYRSPLLLIPLTIKSAFLLVYEANMTVCSGLLEGNQTFSKIRHKIEPASRYHHGKGVPLWISWARPPRHGKFRSTRDDVYVVREDGVVRFLEIDSELPEFVGAGVNVGHLENNCGTALSILDYTIHLDERHRHSASDDVKGGDMLVIGGDSGAGGTYLIQARKTPLYTEPIRNWSPAGDLATTYSLDTHEDTVAFQGPRSRKVKHEKDHIFACVGKGSNGAIAEFRYGLEARLGIETDYGNHILEVWSLWPTLDSRDDGDDSLFLLSLGDHSAVLRLSGDATVIANDEDFTKLHLDCRTITAGICRGLIVQVTERSIVIKRGDWYRVYEKEDILKVSQRGILLGCGTSIGSSVIQEDHIFFTTTFGGHTYVQVLAPSSPDDMETDHEIGGETVGTVRTVSSHSASVSCIGLCTIARDIHVVVAESLGVSLYLTLININLDDIKRHTLKLPSSQEGEHIISEAIVSIAVAYTNSGLLTFLCGTRNGLLLKVIVQEGSFELISFEHDRFGHSWVIVRRDEHFDSVESFFVNCESKIYYINAEQERSPASCQKVGQKWSIRQIWLTDAMKPDLKQPEIISLARLRPNISGGPDGGIVMISGTSLLLAAFSTQPKTVPRAVAIGGTPLRMIYSHYLKALVVAANIDGKSTLLFIDPATGDDLSLPLLNETGVEVEFISGLGKPDDKVYHMIEWSYVKDNKTWPFIVLTTSSGRGLIVSVKVGPGTNKLGAVCGRSKIGFYTRHKHRHGEPIFSVCGFQDGLIWCVGHRLIYEVLDIRAKRFKRLADYELLTPATSLMFDSGFIYALTMGHSLEVLKVVVDDEGQAYEIVHTHADQVARSTLHHGLTGRGTERPIHLVSDKHCSLVGLWATRDTKADTLMTIFEAQLPHSVLRFRQARVRPIWDPVWRSKSPDITSTILLNGVNTRDSTGDQNSPEMIGLSIDGSVSSYTILGRTTWKFLRFLLDRALRSPKVCEFNYKDGEAPLEPAQSPKIMMHVDGDILRRCLDGHYIEELVCLDTTSKQKKTDEVFSKFCVLLQELHEGTLEGSLNPSGYVQQAYEDLAFFLRPVL
ncbi:mono-functional DNA-alkylating methyl methanesulfonate N-term-domain-containing protein [Amylocarpus encephaloides]|uniref:Mono-functional DNA-alkylating methyl methanesulfonate N-term-domain-containing protein n=1 Tax=Amylocarpus encephaloides TaxID=45428 RepID=A0A9P7YE82_9HELO|nr:mono-functional DNA-alkylating methyl methanesulfonate N-term-domain-containing protein [Amylocarpus encephaloides]